MTDPQGPASSDAQTSDTVQTAFAAVRRPLRLTHLGMVAERVARAFWPLWSVILGVAAVLMLGLQDLVVLEVLWAGIVLAGLGLVGGAVYAARRFVWPTRAEALDRLDRTLSGRPITALGDTQAIGAGDVASETVWRAHVARMADRVARAQAAPPDLRVSSRDPYGLRFVAMTAFVLALVFGSLWRVASITDVAPGGEALASGPVWEGWVEPPAYTGRPSLYLNDLDTATLELPVGTRITLRLYGEVGALTVSETVSGRTDDIGSAADPAQEFEVTREGTIRIDGPGGREWAVTVQADTAPSVALDGTMERAADGEMQQSFVARDDFGVVAGTARIDLDMDRLDRRHGLAAQPEPREALLLDLPLSITGDRREFTEEIIENFSEHPWAGLPVTLTLTVEDAIGQTGSSEAHAMALPGRRFFDPLAKSVIEARRDILWTVANGTRAAQVLRAVTHRPDGFVRDESTYLQLRVAIRRLGAAAAEAEGLDPATRDEMAEVLWNIALQIEFGNLNDARERLERAQDRLSEAIENGASDEEIAELMQELREAMQDYMRQLAQQQGQDGQDQQSAQNQQNMQEITGDQLQSMLERLQELMEQGRMAEAQQLLDQLRQMMENMQVTQGQPGQGQQSPGQQAMEGLQETLREQQGLSDDAFRDLQEQFNPGAQAGESGQNQGRSGGQGQGQQHDGTGGQGQAQNGEGADSPGQGQPNAGDLANRQQALRRQLDSQRGNLPGAGTPEGDAAREALGRAGDAMNDAEDALRQDDLAGALDNQAEAMEALREGMRNLGEAMAQEQQQQQGGQGQQAGETNPLGQRDPLGREVGANGRLGTDEELLQGEDVYRRARELLDEIRRRSGDQTRPDAELDYLRRLLDRF